MTEKSCRISHELIIIAVIVLFTVLLNIHSTDYSDGIGCLLVLMNNKHLEWTWLNQSDSGFVYHLQCSSVILGCMFVVQMTTLSRLAFTSHFVVNILPVVSPYFVQPTVLPTCTWLCSQFSLHIIV